MEKIVADIIRGTQDSFCHSIACMTDGDDFARLLPCGVGFVTLHKPAGNSLSFLLKLARHISSVKPDIVNTYNWSGTDGIVASRAVGIKTIIHSEHGWDMEDPYGTNFKRVFIRKLLSYFITEMTCVSKQMETWLISDVKVHCPVRHIYNGVDIDAYTPGKNFSIRQELGIPAQVFVCGMIGRIDQIKDHELMLHAFARFLKLRPASCLLIVGDGPERKHLQKIAGRQVYFLGNRQDIPEILQGLNLFVITSRNEGISCAITEAMASGLPVVASDVGGNPELVDHGQTGLLFPAGDEEALLKCLIKCYDNPAMLSDFGKAGRKKMVENFSISKMIQQYHSLYNKVLKKVF